MRHLLGSALNKHVFSDLDNKLSLCCLEALASSRNEARPLVLKPQQMQTQVKSLERIRLQLRLKLQKARRTFIFHTQSFSSRAIHGLGCIKSL